MVVPVSSCSCGGKVYFPAALQLALNLFGLASSSLLPLDQIFPEVGNSLPVPLPPVTINLSIGLVFVSFMKLLVTALLIHGIRKECTKIMSPWIGCTALELLLHFTLFFMFGIVNSCIVILSEFAITVGCFLPISTYWLKLINKDSVYVLPK
jgi:hypothetical protein